MTPVTYERISLAFVGDKQWLYSNHVWHTVQLGGKLPCFKTVVWPVFSWYLSTYCPQGYMILTHCGIVTHNISESKLAQVMACCLMAPSHYLYQFNLTLVRFSDVHLVAISLEISQPSITKFKLKITYINFHSNLPGANKLMTFYGLVSWTFCKIYFR